MDVRCTKCGIEYEFDASRVPAEGLSVKCSTCHHIFTVFAPAGGDGDVWKVRQANGSVFEFKELTTLQRWIVERKVSRVDEISKTGMAWKKLGDIAELAAFFQVVDQAATGPAPLPQAPASPGARGTWAAGHTQEIPSGARFDHAAGFDDDEATVVDLDGDAYAGFVRPESSNPWKWVVLALVLIVAGAGGWAYLKAPHLLGIQTAPEIPPLALEHLQKGYEALLRDSEPAMAIAQTAFESAAKVAPKWAAAQAGVADVEVARAEWQKLEADILAERLVAMAPKEDEAMRQRVNSLREASNASMKRALGAAAQAMATGADTLEAQRAMANFQRFAGAKEEMDKLVESAKVLGPADARLFYVIGSGLAMDEKTPDRAIRYFDMALELMPNMNRAKVKLALVRKAMGQAPKALEHVEEVLEVVPDHAIASLLKEEIQGVLEKKEAETEEKKQEAVEKKVVATKSAGPSLDSMSFDQLLGLADRARDRDDPNTAMDLYKRAIAKNPDDPDANSGLGWCYLDLENPNAAVGQFRKVVASNPRFTDAHMGLAEAYAAKRMKRDAIKHYKRYLEILPDGPEARVAKRMINELEN